MPAVRFSGMASGLPPNIVETIMEAERIPVQTMEKSKAKEDDRLKIVGDLETKVTDITKNIEQLVGQRGFIENKLLSGDPNIVDGTVDPKEAVTGEWGVEVVQLAQKPGVMSNGFPDADETKLGTGYLKFKTPQGTKEVYISGGSSTLKGVANAINASGEGLRASVVNDRTDPDAPYRLMITGLSTGKDNEVEFPVAYLLDGDEDLSFDGAKAALNAKVKIDGFEVEIPDNVTSELIPGVTLDLKQAVPGREVRVSVKEDLEKIGGKVKGFVDAYNAALGFIQEQHKIRKGPDNKERLGPLGGDSLARTVESRLRQLVMNPQLGLGSKITQLNQLGIEFNRNGTLNYSEEKFNNALKANPKDVAAFFRGDGFNTGFIPTLKREIANLTNGAGGAIANRKRGISQRIDQINQRIDNKEKQLEKKEDSLRRKFSDLESKMSQLQAQGAAVGGMGAALVSGPKG